MSDTAIRVAIEENPVYKQILADSFGGIMYNVANRDKYETSELLRLWDSMTPAGRESSGGIMAGAISFVAEAA